MIFELVKDFLVALAAMPADHPKRRILRLLEEALRRDVHFIARHPTTLFQCMWNTCWWYDCGEAVHHYKEAKFPSLPSPAGRGAGGSSKDDHQLCGLLERWRPRKEELCMRFPWLRSHRPPSMHLGTVLRAILRGHENYVQSVAYSPDGQRIVSGSWGYAEDQGIRVWDAETGAQFAGRGHSANSVAYSPDGRRIVSDSDGKIVRVHEADSGAEVAVLHGHEGKVYCVSYSPDSRHIVSGSASVHYGTSWNCEDDTIRVWDAETGANLAVLRGHEGEVNSVTYSPDGRRIVSGSSDKTIRVWDAENGTQLAVFRGHEERVTSVSYSPDGRRIVSGSSDKTIRVWDAENGTQLVVFSGHEGGVTSVSCSPDGWRIASASNDKTVRVWDTESGAGVATLCGHEERVSSVAFSPDGRHIVSGSWDRTVRIWDAPRSGSNTRLAVLQGHEGVIRGMAFSPDGWRIASASDDKTVQIWDVDSGTVIAVSRGHEGCVCSVSYSPDGRRIASGSWDRTIRIWDAESGVELVALHGGQPVFKVAYSPDGQQIAGGAYKDRTVRVWNIASRLEVAVVRGHKHFVLGVAYSPDGKQIASGSWDGTVRVSDAKSGAELTVLRRAQRVFGVAFSPDGRWIVGNCRPFAGQLTQHNAVRVWDTYTGNCLQVIQGLGDVQAIAAGPSRFPLRAVARGPDTVVERANDGVPVAWFSPAITEIVTRHSGRTWAGASGNHVCIITLEGAEENSHGTT